MRQTAGPDTRSEPAQPCFVSWPASRRAGFHAAGMLVTSQKALDCQQVPSQGATVCRGSVQVGRGRWKRSILFCFFCWGWPPATFGATIFRGFVMIARECSNEWTRGWWKYSIQTGMARTCPWGGRRSEAPLPPERLWIGNNTGQTGLRRPEGSSDPGRAGQAGAANPRDLRRSYACLNRPQRNLHVKLDACVAS